MAKKPLKSEAEQLLQQIDRDRLPQHIAIIMDGNGRWARAHGYRDRIFGHRAGVEAVRETIRACVKLNIKILTLYAFSKENWRRPKREIKALMMLLESYLKKERKTLSKHNIKLIASGNIEDLPQSTQRVLHNTMEFSRNHQGLIVNLALSYSGRNEIADAAQRMVREAMDNKIKPEEITPELFATYLYNPELPEPDLLIRTSGEMRISNFLLWQIAYTEIYVTPVLWPDFSQYHLYEAIIDFQRRERRFGDIRPRGIN